MPQVPGATYVSTGTVQGSSTTYNCSYSWYSFSIVCHSNGSWSDTDSCPAGQYMHGLHVMDKQQCASVNYPLKYIAFVEALDESLSMTNRTVYAWTTNIHCVHAPHLHIIRLCRRSCWFCLRHAVDKTCCLSVLCLSMVNDIEIIKLILKSEPHQFIYINTILI